MLNKRLGQHFLRDDAVVADIVAAIAPAEDDVILEIGAGNGALTDRLQDSAARVVALEIDERFANALKERYAQNPRATVIHTDALQADWRALAMDAGGDNGNDKAGGKFRLAGNLPYNLSSPLLLKMAQHARHLRDCHVMTQREVGERVCAAPGGKAYGRLSVQMQLFFTAQVLLPVPPQAFTPPPQVESVVFRLLPTTSPPLPDCFQDVLAAAFGQRRKTLKNALANFSVNWSACPIDPTRRAESLSPAEFVALARHCAK